uniref:G-protein coupled receptors family 1 profile domain-containing protein n=1 Tax=Leptobrachium leishanense TaxID=445787 RepID=A0A8C5QFJ1_9ANUR
MSCVASMYLSSDWQTAVYFFSYILSVPTCVLGIMGNIVVIYMAGFVLKERLSMIWFLNLAIADIIYLFFSPLNFVSALTREWPFGSLECNLYHFFSSAHTYSTIIIITALNVVCTLQVAKPTWHKYFISGRSRYYVCATIWTITILSSLPAVFHTDEHIFGDAKQCILFHYDLLSFSHVSRKYRSNIYGVSIPSQVNKQDEGSGSMLYNATVDTFENISNAILDFVPTNVPSYDVPKTALTASQNITSYDATNLTSIQVLSGSLTNVVSTTSTINGCQANDSQVVFQTIWNEMMFSTKCLAVPLLVIGYIIPLCVIITSNIIIALKVRKSPKKKPISLYRITVALGLVFFITKTPTVIAQIIFLVTTQDKNVQVMVDIMNILPVLSSLEYVSSCLNPFVYVMFGKQILRLLTGSSGSVFNNVFRSRSQTFQ